MKTCTYSTIRENVLYKCTLDKYMYRFIDNQLQWFSLINLEWKNVDDLGAYQDDSVGFYSYDKRGR